MGYEAQKMRTSQKAGLQGQDLAFGFLTELQDAQTSLPDNSLLTAQAPEHKLVQQVSALNYPTHFVTPNCLDFHECREGILRIW